MILKTSQGFTLIEIIIVVTIIGLLAMIAVPSYDKYITKSRRADAKASLMELSQIQENFYGDNNGQYAEDLEKLGASSKYGFIKGSGNKFISREKFYELSVKDATDPKKTYTLEAIPIPGGDQESREKRLKSEGCLSFTIDAAGQKTSSPKIDCWQ